VDLSPAVGRAVLMIGLEALHNCARHAKATSATLDLQASGHDWVLSVSDDGRGFPPDAASGSGFGLHTMRRRAGEIGGSLDVESRPGRGTIVRLTFNPRGRSVGAHRMIIREIWTRVRRIS
jgi:signal transduction histidine kinase